MRYDLTTLESNNAAALKDKLVDSLCSELRRVTELTDRAVRLRLPIDKVLLGTIARLLRADTEDYVGQNGAKGYKITLLHSDVEIILHCQHLLT
jgi:hypothetical protein